jgi:hypothetical protein
MCVKSGEGKREERKKLMKNSSGEVFFAGEHSREFFFLNPSLLQI